MSRQSIRTARVALLAAGLTLVAAGTADAAVDGTVAKVSSGLTTSEVRFTAVANATSSHMTFEVIAGQVVVKTPTTGSELNAGAGCTKFALQEIRCSTANVNRVGALLGAGNDTAFNKTTIPAFFQGQDGNDSLYGGALPGSLVSGPYVADDLRGGNGNDTLWGWGGNDTVVGDAGVDTASYFLWPHRLTISVDGFGNDGMAGERANIQTENIIGGLADDHLSGDGGANVIDGTSGNDTIWGNLGADTIFGSGGDDKIHARAWDSDTVNCGEGTGDAMYADLLPLDPSPTGCETVQRSLL